MKTLMNFMFSLLTLAMMMSCQNSNNQTSTQENSTHNTSKSETPSDSHHQDHHSDQTTSNFQIADYQHQSLPKSLFEGEEHWIEEMKKNDPNFFDKLALGQSPKYLLIGCSDSRVPVAQLLGLKAGEIFVHRNIANLATVNDPSVNAVVEYAVDHLGIEHIIICGHTDCGGVKAALSHHDHGGLNSWLNEIRVTIDENAKELSQIKDQKELVDDLVRLNVLKQCQNLMKFSCVQKSWKQKGIPHIQGLIFDVATAKLTDLDVDNKELYQQIKFSSDIEL
ncbi:MAG: carbonic anhydrase [Rikenellaceae bacterium]